MVLTIHRIFSSVNMQAVDEDLISSLLTSQYSSLDCTESPKEKSPKVSVQKGHAQSAKKVILTKPYAGELTIL